MLLRVLLPTSCPVCRRIGPAPCTRCMTGLRPPPDLPAPPGVDRWVAAVSHQGVGGELVRRLKYDNHRDALAFLAGALVWAVDGEQVDLVTWVPAGSARRRARGFDQGELIAREVARRLGRPVRPCLRRLDQGQQARSSRAERLRGPLLVPRWPKLQVQGSVLMVDDVRTTGSTLRAAAGVLRAMGAERILAGNLSASPDPFQSEGVYHSESKPSHPATKGADREDPSECTSYNGEGP